MSEVLNRILKINDNHVIIVRVTIRYAINIKYYIDKSIALQKKKKKIVVGRININKVSRLSNFEVS